MGIDIVEASAERVVGRMPVDGNRQPYGLLHGGATVVLAEGLGSLAGATAESLRAGSRVLPLPSHEGERSRATRSSSPMTRVGVRRPHD